VLGELGLEVRVFASSAELIETEQSSEPALVVLVPAEGAVPTSAVSAVARRLRGVPIVLVCAALERWDVRSALAAGAAGVSCAEQPEALGVCVAAVLAGQSCVPRAHARQIDPPALSAREKQILGLLVMGYMNSQIAERLYLAESTVKSHLSSAFGKLGVRSRNQAVDMILDPERGLGMGILGLGGERIEAEPVASAREA
jgi:DNA-binding NarL/FixJ family response regulator